MSIGMLLAAPLEALGIVGAIFGAAAILSLPIPLGVYCGGMHRCRRYDLLARGDGDSPILPPQLRSQLMRMNLTRVASSADRLLEAYVDVTQALPGSSSSQAVDWVHNNENLHPHMKLVHGEEKHAYNVTAAVESIPGVDVLSHEESEKLGLPPGHLLWYSSNVTWEGIQVSLKAQSS